MKDWIQIENEIEMKNSMKIKNSIEMNELCISVLYYIG